MKLLAIIVTFEPDESFLAENCQYLHANKIDFLIIDNSEVNPVRNSEYNIITNQHNLGIAAAQNQGIRYAIERDYEGVILFDQDSSIKSNNIGSLINDFKANNLEVMAPICYNREENFFYKLITINDLGIPKKISPQDFQEKFQEIDLAIASGKFIKTNVFKKVGLFNEDLFIDYVDHEWCLRLKKNETKIVVNKDYKIDHSIGERNLDVLGFKIPIHQPLRRYYRVRNAILMLRNSNVPLLFSLREIFFSAVHSLFLILSQKDKLGYIYYYFKAVYDGLLNRKGIIN